MTVDDDSESFETEDEAEPIGTSGTPLSPGKALIAKQERERLKRLAKERKAALDKYRDEMNVEASKDEKSKARDRMRYLLKQADIFQHFMNVDGGDAKGKGKAKAGEGAGARGRKREEEEDKELLKDEMDDGKALTQAHRLTVQPSCIKFGTMRDYQLQGLNWMITCTTTESTASWRTRWAWEKRCRRSLSWATCTSSGESPAHTL